MTDGALIMVGVPDARNYRWRELKRMMARAIKHDPAAVNGIFDRARDMLAPATIDEAHSTLPIHEQGRTAEDSQEMHWAILQLSGTEGYAEYVGTVCVDRP